MATALTKSKLPQVTLVFWIMKICATTLGETGGDQLAQTMKVGYAVSTLILISVFLVAVVTQLRARNFHPVLYWTVIVSTSTAGTTMSDYMDRTLKLGYGKGTLILVSLLASVLIYWRLRIGSMDVSNIMSFRVELIYWMAILFSNTLGTALGDYLSDSSGLGFGGGALLISGVLGLIVMAYYRTQISKVLLFWMAFVLTRPLGATVGDFFWKPHAKGGLGFGTAGSSLVLLAALVGVIVVTTKKSDTPEPALPAPEADEGAVAPAMV